MSHCVVCGQAFPGGRADKLTCSPRCRTKRYRQAQQYQSVAQGPQTWYRQLVIAQPIAFWVPPQDEAQPLSPDDNRHRVTQTQWTPTLAVLNKVYFLWEQIQSIGRWQGQTGANEHGIAADEREHNDVGQAILYQVMDLGRLESGLHIFRGQGGRWLAPHLPVLVRLRGELIDQARQWVAAHQALADPYVVIFDIRLQSTLATYQAELLQCWFAIFDNMS